VHFLSFLCPAAISDSTPVFDTLCAISPELLYGCLQIQAKWGFQLPAKNTVTLTQAADGKSLKRKIFTLNFYAHRVVLQQQKFSFLKLDDLLI